MLHKARPETCKSELVCYSYTISSSASPHGPKMVKATPAIALRIGKEAAPPSQELSKNSIELFLTSKRPLVSSRQRGNVALCATHVATALTLGVLFIRMAGKI